jgi:hypothetical protein
LDKLADYTPPCCCAVQVRRKADGAKDLVKEFVGKWRDNEAVIGDVTHTEMKGDQAQLPV